MIKTLAITILVEGAIGISYSIWQKKPVGSILITSVFANVITQSLLWIVLNIFFQHYLMIMLIAEFLIWILEGILLYMFRSNQLSFMESLFLSFVMNLSSFAMGWWLPV